MNKETKLAKSKEEETAIFKLFSNGVNTARDEWVFDYNVNHLLEKIQYFIDKYNLIVSQSDNKKIDDILDDSIKWSADLKNSLLRKIIINFNDEKVVKYNYRPFVKNYYYSEQLLSDRLTLNHYAIFCSNLISDNIVILLSGNSASKPFTIFSSNIIFSFDTLEKTQCLPLYTYDKEGKREENITDWGLAKFIEYYRRGLTSLNPTSPENQNITKEDIFYYVYGVLHNPKYREKYELNLKREFPRIPFYDDFYQWVNWGKMLMNLHLNYDAIAPYNLKDISNNY